MSDENEVIKPRPWYPTRGDLAGMLDFHPVPHWIERAARRMAVEIHQRKRRRGRPTEATIAKKLHMALRVYDLRTIEGKTFEVAVEDIAKEFSCSESTVTGAVRLFSPGK